MQLVGQLMRMRGHTAKTVTIGQTSAVFLLAAACLTGCGHEPTAAHPKPSAECQRVRRSTLERDRHTIRGEVYSIRGRSHLHVLPGEQRCREIVQVGGEWNERKSLSDYEESWIFSTKLSDDGEVLWTNNQSPKVVRVQVHDALVLCPTPANQVVEHALQTPVRVMHFWSFQFLSKVNLDPECPR